MTVEGCRIRLMEVALDLSRMAGQSEPSLELQWGQVTQTSSQGNAIDVSAGLECEWWLEGELLGSFTATYALEGLPSLQEPEALADLLERHIWPAWRLLAESLHGQAGFAILLPLELPPEGRAHLLKGLETE